MSTALRNLKNDLRLLCEAWEGALPAFSVSDSDDTDDAVEVASMSHVGLLASTDVLGHLVRDVNAVFARFAGEVARRSSVDLGMDGLAKRQGFQNPAHLIAAATGGALSEASRMVEVGKATAPRVSLTGEVLPPAHPHVAVGVASGDVSVDAAAAITSMLDRVSGRADPVVADAVEEILTERAAELPHDLLLRMVREAEARLDADGVAPREEVMRAARSVRIREDLDGMIRLHAVLDPETGAPVKAAIEALVTNMIRTDHRDAEPDPDRVPDAGGGGFPVEPVVPDRRTVPQLQADALSMIARHVLGCSRMPSAPSTTMVVRIDLDTLTDGVGHGVVDGVRQPVSAGTIRKMAATAGLIPAVFGGESFPLDLGRNNRLFSWAQRIALAERDGGCASCGLDVAYTEAHHILWWLRDAGPTDLSNGVLLCPPCHTRIHHDGWVIQIRDGQVWFIPPPHVDPDQTPRLGGKARYALPAIPAAGVRPTVNSVHFA